MGFQLRVSHSSNKVRFPKGRLQKFNLILSSEQINSFFCYMLYPICANAMIIFAEMNQIKIRFDLNCTHYTDQCVHEYIWFILIN